MKKMLIVILLVCSAASLFGAVDMRMRKVSSTQGTNPGDPESVTVAVEIRSTAAYTIYNFRGSFDVGDVLQAVLTSQSLLDADLFTAVNYTRTTSVSGGVAKFKYEALVAGTGTTLATNTWQEVIRFTFNWNYDGSLSTDFAWNDDDDGFLFNIEVWVGSPFDFPISVTGGRQSPSAAGLTDYSLPVLLTDFNVDYSYENGSLVTWVCANQTNCEQFILKRTSDGVNWEEICRINGAGTTSSTLTYEYTDFTAEAGKDYLYRLFEVSDGTTDAINFFQIQTLAAPTQFKLVQNFPNPFNPDTHIPFEILNKSHVSLKVYNLLGQEIVTLINEDRNAGIYEITWNGTNNNGIQVPSGVYLYKLKAGDNVQVKKMTKLQ